MLQRAILVAGTLAIAAVGPGCGGYPGLPSSPSMLDEGIVLFEHAGFLGESAHITADIPDLRKFDGPCLHQSDDGDIWDWNDCLSSVRVAPGWRATIYKDTNYRDESFEVTSDVQNLQLVPGTGCKTGLNDCVSSVRVRRQ